MVDVSFSSSSEDSSDELSVQYLLVRKPKIFQPRVDQLEKWNDHEFQARFRLSKELVKFLAEKIHNDIAPKTNKNNAVSSIDMLLLTLRFYATGTFQMVSGDLRGLHKSTVCRCIRKTVKAIAKLGPDYVYMPRNKNEIDKNVVDFYRIARFPNTIGAIDGTHVPIKAPNNNAEYYRNRKGYFSYNVQVVANAQLMIMDVVARWPGSAHDSTIYNNSAIKARLESYEFNSKHVLGDKGYENQRCLLTPLRNPQTNAENLYNESHIRTRNVVERTFGLWKRRFPAIRSKLRINTNMVQDTIVAAAVLHNLCILWKESDPTDTDIDLITVIDHVDGGIIMDGNNNYRQHLIQNFFSHI